MPKQYADIFILSNIYVAAICLAFFFNKLNEICGHEWSSIIAYEQERQLKKKSINEYLSE